MIYLRLLVLLFGILVVVLVSYKYGRYVELRSVLSSELVAYEYDILVLENAEKAIDLDGGKAEKLLREHIAYKRALVVTNKKWLHDANYIQLLFSEFYGRSEDNRETGQP